eukprot:TRINITY_DN1449_c0_g1_i4.p1 TRINITY_DN1449_c0_g1~~TRINITY_DN1449_c0_g1_i4.p1  ORF type:complete len:240 (-),score=32.33 TRINITY_DN1449_c0_g1_i4:88-807(-)
MERIRIGNKNISLNTLFKVSTLQPHVRTHLLWVYTTLVALLVVASLGSFVHLFRPFGGIVTALVGLGLISYLSLIPHNSSNVVKRLGVLLSFGFFEGASIGPLLERVLSFEGGSKIIFSALLGTSIIFMCFSLSALFAQRRSFLFLASLVYSGLSCLVFVGTLNLFFASTFLMNISLYLGLMVFCGFIIFDTQIIIEKADAGNSDFIWDALELFLDFVQVFVRVLIILTKKNSKEESRR